MLRKPAACPNCGTELPSRSRALGLVKTYAGPCSHCGARVAFDGTGDVWLIIGKWSTQDPAEAAELARREGIPWPPRKDGEP